MPADVISVGSSNQQAAPPNLVFPSSSPRAARKGTATSVAPPLTSDHKSKLFSEALLEVSSVRQPRRPVDLVFSILFHTLILLALVLTPLYFTETIDIKGFTLTMLVAPPPPPPLPPAGQAIARTKATPRRTFVLGGRLIAPTFIPQKVAVLKEEALPPDVGLGVVGGVPGGVPGGQLGGVIGGIIADASHTSVPVPAATAAQLRAPVRVGGRIRPPRLISRATPAYPALAKQTRVQGAVTIDAVIDTEGNVVEMRVVSGHPLLISAALDAVRQWKYESTYLNDHPIAVQLIVTVTFQLGS
jgi:protein TonB